MSMCMGSAPGSGAEGEKLRSECWPLPDVTFEAGEDGWPSPEGVVSADTLRAYALAVQEFVNSHPILDADDHASITNAALERLNEQFQRIYGEQALVVEGDICLPYITTGGAVRYSQQYGILRGHKGIGFYHDVTPVRMDFDEGSSSFLMVRFGYLIDIEQTARGMAPYGRYVYDLAAFAPVESCCAYTDAEYARREMVRARANFAPRDVIIEAIDEATAISPLDLPELARIFSRIRQDGATDKTYEDYLAYLDAITQLDGQSIRLVTQEAAFVKGIKKLDGDEELELQKVSEEISMEGLFFEFVSSDGYQLNDKPGPLFEEGELCVAIKAPSVKQECSAAIIPARAVLAWSVSS